MNLLGMLSVLWQILKATVANETVNKAMDNWTKGTSNQIDDWVWKLLEDVTGVKDEETRKVMLEDGLKAIEEKYIAAKAEGRVDELKAPIRKWAAPTMADVHYTLAGEFVATDNIA